MIRFLFVLSLNLLSLLSFADFDVQGNLKDEEGNALSYASVVLLFESDSTMAGYGISDADGNFTFSDIEPGKYIFRSSYVGYADFEKNLDFTSVDQNTVKLPSYQMEKAQVSLDELVVEEKIIPVTINKDTVEYDPRAFKPKVDDTVEDLLKKLPGVEVDRDGTIKAQGEEVAKVMVDGKEFFGDDPTTATQNLPADAIDKVQVFDKLSDFSEFSGIDDGERNKTINLKLKEDKKKGVFGKTSAGYGTNDRYDMKNNIHSFKKGAQISFLANGNNINEAAFSIRDYIQFLGGIQQLMQSGGFQIGGNGLSFSGNAKGDNDQLGFGSNINLDLSPKTELSMNYLGSVSKSETTTDRSREYFNNPRLTTMQENIANTTGQNNHIASGRVRYKPDSSLEYDVNFKGRYQFGNGSAFQSIATTGTEGNTQRQEQYSTSELFNGELSVKRRKRFGKNSVWINGFNYTTTNQDGQTLFTSPFDRTTALNQLTNVPQEEMGFSSSVASGMGKYFVLSMSGSYNYSLNSQRNNLITTQGLQPNAEDNFRTNQKRGLNQLTVGPGMRFKKNKTNISFNSQFLHADFKTSFGTQNKWHWLPSFMFDKDFRGGKSFDIRASRSISYPTLSQIFEFVDYTQVGRQYVGNPFLEPEDKRNATLHFNSFSQFSFTSLFVNLVLEQTKNKIQTGLSVDDQGAIVTTPQNTSNEDRVSSYVSFSKGFGKLNYKWAVRGVYANGFQPNQGVELATTNLNGSGKFSIENRKKENWDWITGVDYSINRSIQSDFETSFSNMVLFAEVELPLGDRWELSSVLDYTFLFRDDQSSIEIPIHTLGVKFFTGAGKRLSIEANWYDVWNQTQGIFRDNNFQYSEVEQSNVLTSYGMLKLNYRLSKFKKDEGVFIHEGGRRRKRR